MVKRQLTQVDVWAGLDVGKTNHYGTVLDNDGDELFARPVPNTEATLKAYLTDAAQHGNVALVIDQPGSIAQLALAVAAKLKIPVAYIPGLVMRRAAQLYPGEAKTDPRDSYVIADTARVHRKRIAWIDVTEDLIGNLRVLCGYDEDLAHDTTRIANRIRDALTSICPTLEAVLGDRLDHPAVRALLAELPTPTLLRQAGRTRILAILKPHAPRIGARLTDEILAAIQAQTVTMPAETTIGRVIADLAVDLGRLHDRRDSLLDEIEELFLTHPCGPVLLSLPGIGPRTGPRILVEIGDGSRFATGAQLASYAGLAPVTHQSGSSIKGEQRSRRGNHRLKNAMFQAAFASLKAPASRAYYDKKRAENKKHNAAIIALARRRCDVILAMLRTLEHYNPDHRSPGEQDRTTAEESEEAA